MIVDVDDEVNDIQVDIDDEEIDDVSKMTMTLMPTSYDDNIHAK